MRIAVIGAGPAGIEAALAARKAGAQRVMLYSREAVLPYSRPHLPAAAFSDGDVAPFTLHPRQWYAERGIDLRLDTPVLSLNVDDRIVQTPDGDELFDAAVIATGANPLKPVIPGIMASPALYTMWSAGDARKLARHCRRGRSVVVVGGGILGVEAALSAAGMGKKVVLVEKSARLMESMLDKESSAAVANVLANAGVETRLSSSVLSGVQAGSKIQLKLDGGASPVETDAVILAVGARANLSLAKSAGLAVDRGICVDNTLQTTAQYVYAAGDCAQPGAGSHSCVPAAIDAGRIAGYNAVASVSGAEPLIWPGKAYPLHYYGEQLQIHAWGLTAERSINAKILKITGGKRQAGAVRIKVVRPDGVILGVQMIGTDAGFDEFLSEQK